MKLTKKSKNKSMKLMHEERKQLLIKSTKTLT